MQSNLRSLRNFLVCVLACLLGCFAGCQSLFHPEKVFVAGALRVMTYNTHHGEGTDGTLDLGRIADIINQHEPDLVALQEIDVRAARTNTIDQPKTYSTLTGLAYAFSPFMDFDGGEYGLVVLSRYPITRSWQIPLPPGLHEPRNAQAIEINIPGRGIVVFVCVHFDWLDDDAQRLAQAHALIASLSDETSPIIIAGDFNDTHESRTMGLFFQHFVDAAKPAGNGATFPSSLPTKQIDYVLYSPASAFDGTSRVIDERVASDHRPVVGVLRIQ